MMISSKLVCTNLSPVLSCPYLADVPFDQVMSIQIGLASGGHDLGELYICKDQNEEKYLAVPPFQNIRHKIFLSGGSISNK